MATGSGGISGSMSGYPVLYTPEEATKESQDAVLGTVVEVLPASWSTSDRKPPALAPGEPPGGEMIYTPVRIRVDKRYKGRVGEFVVVKYFGGRIDENTAMSSETLGDIPAIGDRLVVFVGYTFREKNGDTLEIPLDIYEVSAGKAKSQTNPKAVFYVEALEQKINQSLQ